MAPLSLTCASCGPKVPAGVLVLHPSLNRIAVPLCALKGLHGASDATPDDVVRLGTPEGDAALATYHIAAGFVVSRAG